MGDFNNRRYLILDASEIDKIDYDQIFENNQNSLSYSFDLSKVVIKWNIPDSPSFISNLQSAEGPYTHTEIISILSGDGWSYKK